MKPFLTIPTLGILCWLFAGSKGPSSGGFKSEAQELTSRQPLAAGTESTAATNGTAATAGTTLPSSGGSSSPAPAGGAVSDISHANMKVNIVMWSWSSIVGHSIPRYLSNMEKLIAKYGPGGSL